MWVWNKLDKVWTLNPRRVWNCCFSFTQARYFNQSQPISSLTQAGGYTLLTRMKWFTEFIDLLRSLCKVPTGGGIKQNKFCFFFLFLCKVMGNANRVWLGPWFQVLNPHYATYQLCNPMLLLNFTGPQFSHLQKGDNYSSYCTESLWELG